MDDHDDNARAFVLLSNSKVGNASRLRKSNSESKVTVKKEFR